MIRSTLFVSAEELKQQAFEDLDGFISSRVLIAAIQLGLFRHLDGCEMDKAEIADVLGLDAAKGTEFLNICARLGYLAAGENGRYALTDLGQAIVDDLPRFDAYAEERAYVYKDLLQLEQVLKEGKNTTQTHQEWAYTRSPEGRSELSVDSVKGYSQHMAASSRFWARQVLDNVSLASVDSILDVGGGSGSFAIEVARDYPHMRVGVFDLPSVGELARDRVAESQLEGRVAFHGGDFLHDELPRGYAAASLNRICWDWQDDDVLRLVRNIYEALQPGGILLVAEGMYTDDKAADRQRARHGVRLLFMDGKLRSVQGLSALISQAGFDSTAAFKTRVPGFVVLRAVK